MPKIAILGAGSWGTALAIHCARIPGQQVYLWGHRGEHIDNLITHRCNRRYLPNIGFPENLNPISNISLINDCDMLLLAVPSSAFRETLKRISPFFSHQDIGWAIKGFDDRSNDLLSHPFTQQFPGRNYAIIAGPSFAKEVAQGLPGAVTIAANTLDFANDYAAFMHHQSLRTYTTDDIIGVQIGGACKNIIAIAAGISDGLGFGANARAAIITRGLHEISRIAERAGARRDTLMGLSGLGDLLLTCTDDLSRNRRFGYLLGQGKHIAPSLAAIGQTVEGYQSTGQAQYYARQYDARTPIINTVADIIGENISVDEAIRKLLFHHPKHETGD